MWNNLRHHMHLYCVKWHKKKSLSFIQVPSILGLSINSPTVRNIQILNSWMLADHVVDKFTRGWLASFQQPHSRNHGSVVRSPDAVHEHFFIAEQHVASWCASNHHWIRDMKYINWVWIHSHSSVYANYYINCRLQTTYVL